MGVGLFLFRHQARKIWKTVSPSSTRFGMAGKYTLQNLPEEVTSRVSFGLTKLSSSGTPEPAAALSWEVKNQGKQYLFHLDPLLHWQDGSLLKAADIKYQIAGVKISARDDYTVIFELEKPFSPLPTLVSTPLFKERLIGLGKFKVKKIRLNAGYLSSLLLESRRERIFFRFYPTQKELITAFKLGEVDCVLKTTSIKELKNWNNIKISPQQEGDKRYAALFFNTRKAPFNNKRIRQALAYSIQKPEEAKRVYTPISPLSWAYNKNVKTYPYNPKHAQKIMEEAFKEKEKSDLKIQITTTFELSEWGEQIKADWERVLGIKVSIRILPFISPNQDFDVILGYGLITRDPDQYSFWHSQQPGNITGFSNVRIDKLLEEGRVVLNKEERKRIYKDFQRFLLEELPAIFLFSPTTYNICRESVFSLN